MSKYAWAWANFDYISLKGGMDSRNAAFLLYDFLNMFGIKDFHIVSSNGEFQNQSISIVYIEPPKYKDGEIEDKWYEHIKELKSDV